MPLLEIWKATKEPILRMTVEAIVRISGNGQLKDGNETSAEFRAFLSEVDSDKLGEYALYCLENQFTDSGQVLQDIINEIGRRLSFAVEHGRYHGVRNDIGFDGLWSSGDESLVVEVKTTNAYTINLDVIANYRNRLLEAGRIPKDTPILLVIGRNDTESLEAQVRGSRHAWSMRIIGVEALIKLMHVNLNTSGEQVTSKIHKILRPFEYTRIDDIVDIVFTTAEDKEIETEIPDANELDLLGQEEVNYESRRVQNRTPRAIIDDKKRSLINKFGDKIGKALQKRRNSMYSDATDVCRAIVAVSKFYDKSSSYWYAYHDEPQRKFLSQSMDGVLILGTTDGDDAFALPFTFLEKHWDDLNSTVRPNGREYKHLHLHPDSQEKFSLRMKNGNEVSIEEFRF